LGTTKGWLGYAGAALFGLGMLVALLQLVPGSSYLKIDETGVEFSVLFRKSTLSWSLVEEFFVVSLKQTGVTVNKMVAFNYVPTSRGQHLGSRIARTITQCDGALPDTYGKSAEELAMLLNSYLDKIQTGERGARLNRGGVRIQEIALPNRLGLSSPPPHCPHGRQAVGFADSEIDGQRDFDEDAIAAGACLSLVCRVVVKNSIDGIRGGGDRCAIGGARPDLREVVECLGRPNNRELHD
jgi:hypothetical protein